MILTKAFDGMTYAVLMEEITVGQRKEYRQNVEFAVTTMLEGASRVPSSLQ